jgi:hypothetical protein
MANHSHAGTVPYLAETVTLTDDQLKEWTRRQVGRIRQVAGWCPTCGARASRVEETDPEPEYVAPEADGDHPTEEKPSEMIFVTCECGFAHGQDGAESCGRNWFVPWDKVASEAD